MASMANCLENGIGCQESLEKAIEWYERAASWGDQKAGERLLILIANPATIDSIFENGYVAPAA